MSAEASAARNATLLLAGQLLGAAVTAGLTIYLARALGPREFGVFSLALGVSATLMLFSDGGIASSAARFAAEHRGERAEVAEVLASALRLKLWLSGAVCIALVLLAGPIEDAYDADGLDWALRAMAIVLFAQNLMGLYGSAFTALLQATYSFRMVVAKSIAEAAGTVALVVVTAGATEAAFGRAIGFGVGAVVAIGLAARVLGLQSIGVGVRERTSTRRVAGYAGAIFLIEAAFSLFDQIDVLLIGAILTATAAGQFQAPLRLITFLGYPAQALANAVAPRLASRTGEGRDVTLFVRGLRYTILFQAALIAPLVVWAEPIVDLLLGSGYEESAEVLRGLAPFVFLLGVGTVLAYGLNYLGQAPRRVPIAIATVGVNVVLDLILIPEWGIVAGAVATDVAFFLYVTAHIWLCRGLVDLPLRPLALSLGRCAIGVAAAAGILLALGTGDDVSVPLLFAGSALALAVYAAVLFLLREASPAELRELARRLRPGSA